MKGVIIVIVALVFAVIILFFRHKSSSGQKQKATTTMNRLLSDETSTGLRVIEVTMTEEEVNNAVDGFVKLNSNHNSSVERPMIQQKGDSFLLVFPDNTKYDQFCFWVNYVVYSNRAKRYNDNVIGWYEVGAEAAGAWSPFVGQKLMFFIPASDDEFDNVYFTTEDNRCYKQQFAFRASLIEQGEVYKEYEAPTR